GPVTARLLGDLGTVGRHDEARELTGFARTGDGVANQRERAQPLEVLARQPLGASPGGDGAEGVGAAHRLSTTTQRRSVAGRRAASIARMVLGPSQPSQRGVASPRMQARKWRASSRYMSLSCPPEG